MFDYLCHKVKPTEDSVRVMVDKELPELVSRIQGDSPDDDLSRLCLEIDRGSSWLGKAVRAGGIAFVNSYKDSYPEVPDELWSAIQVWCAASTLAVLRLVERELQAEDLAKKLGITDE
ncbi:MAG: hypothetical protein FJZ88_06535 [Chloroflexi bacterium]|nr:hypothetical protein [Chloroflexota bacterium]